jgi:hypothetical protein
VEFSSFVRHRYFVGGLGAIVVGLLVFVLYPVLSNAEAPVIRKGATTTYGVLAATTITNTGATTISGTAGGDVGLSPGTSYTGSETVVRSGVDHINDAEASVAQTDLITAYNDLGVPTPTVLGASDLAGQVVTTGTYSTADGTFSNSGTLRLDAQGDPDAVFIFQAASTVITSTDSTMLLVNGAQSCNVYWQVGSSATIGVNSTFVGHVYALTSITANSGATIEGQLLAREAAVTLNGNTITNDACAAAVATTVATTTTVAATTTTTAAPATTTTIAPTTTTVATTDSPAPTTLVPVTTTIVTRATSTTTTVVRSTASSLAPTTTTSITVAPSGTPALPTSGNDDLLYGLIAVLIIAVGFGILRRS